MDPNDHRIWFLRGVLAALASTRQTITYDELRRLCRLSDEQLGAFLNEVRRPLEAREPDLCSIVVKSNGTNGGFWGDPDDSPQEALHCHQFWQDRRGLDNDAFQRKWGRMPSIPGLPSDWK